MATRKSTAEKYSKNVQMVWDMIHYSKENGFTSFSELIYYAGENREDWFRYLCAGSGVGVLAAYFGEYKDYDDSRH